MPELTADLIYGFTQTVLLSRFDSPKPTPELHREIWELACSEHTHVAIAAPRGHAKSTAVTHSFTLAAVLFRFRDFVLIVSDTEGQAIQFLGDIKRELLENDALIQLFGIRKLIKETESDIICEFTDGKQFRIMARGSEQKVRGLKWRNKRPNLVIGDDLENDEIVLNEDRRNKFKNWVLNALLPAGSDDCLFRFVGTILHLDSFLEGVMPPLGHEKTVDLGLKQIYTGTDRTWLSVRYKAHTDDFKQILWPEKFTRERLELIRSRYLEQGNPEGYAQEYLNYPIDESTSHFRKEDFLPIEDREEPLEYYATADLAISEKDRRAYTVITVAGMNAEGVLKFVDVRRFRGDAYDIIEEMFAIQIGYEPSLFGLETENIAKTIGPVLEKEMRERGIYINIEKLAPITDKVRRSRSLQARMRAKRVQFDTEASWFPEFQQEFLQFPKGKYLDQVDAASWIGILLDKMVNAFTRKEMEDSAYEEEYEEFMVEDGSINWITGY